MKLELRLFDGNTKMEPQECVIKTLVLKGQSPHPDIKMNIYIYVYTILLPVYPVYIVGSC